MHVKALFLNTALGCKITSLVKAKPKYEVSIMFAASCFVVCYILSSLMAKQCTPLLTKGCGRDLENSNFDQDLLCISANHYISFRASIIFRSLGTCLKWVMPYNFN